MAANITIERGLNQQSSTQTAPLIGFNYQQGIQFTYDHGAETNTYAEINWNGYVFRAVKIAAVSATVDRYQTDMTDIVKATKTIAPFSVTIIGLLQTIAYTIYGRKSNGDAYVDSGAQTVYLSFAKPNLLSGLYDLYTNGLSRIIYHSGKYCQFVSGTPAYEITSANTNDSTHIYKAVTGVEIAWINRDGAWSFWNFRKISEVRNSKKSNEVQNYSLSNFELAAKTYMLDTELSVEVVFDTVAIDANHYRQLTEIGESERVIYAGRSYSVKSSSQNSAEYKQNLKFNLTLQIQENA
jgi:hypothetical protein